ncbi:hypothetical protein XP4B_22040, partial [Xanthomonas perforans]
PGVGKPPPARTSNRLRGAGRCEALPMRPAGRPACECSGPQKDASAAPPRKKVNKFIDLTPSNGTRRTAPTPP